MQPESRPADAGDFRTSAVIDLGELPAGGAAAPADAGWPGGRHPPRRHLRAGALTAAAVLVAATLPGAESPTAPALVNEFTVVADAHTIDQEHLYVLDRDPTRATHGLAAYRLDGGDRVWHVPAAEVEGRDHVHMEVDETGLLLHLLTDGPGESQLSERDPATGQLRWLATGASAGRTGDTLLVHRLAPEPDPHPPIAEAPGLALTEVSALDRERGEVAWQITVRGEPLFGFPDPGDDVFVAFARDGTLTAYDLRTGAVRASRPTAVAGSDSGVQVVGSLVLLPQRREEGTGRIAAYHADTLEPVWTAELPGSFRFFLACAELICGVAPDSGEVHAIDPASGLPQWRVGDPAGPLFPSASVVDQRHPLRDHLLFTDGPAAGDPLGEQRHLLVDTSSGEPVLESTGWRLLPVPGSPSDVPAWAFAQPAEGPVWVGRLAPDLTGIEPLAPLREAGNCRAAGRYLACTGGLDAAQSVEIWRLP